MYIKRTAGVNIIYWPLPQPGCCCCLHMNCLTLCFAANILKVFDSFIKIQTWKNLIVQEVMAASHLNIRPVMHGQNKIDARQCKGS